MSVHTMGRLLHKYGASLAPRRKRASGTPRKRYDPLKLAPGEKDLAEALAGGVSVEEAFGFPPGVAAVSARDAPNIRRRAQILLLAQERPRPVPDIAKACGCTEPTVYGVLNRYRAGGLEGALLHKSHTYTRLVTPEMAERVTALSRSPPPAGHRRWTDVLLARAAVEQGIAERISRNTVSRILSKRRPRPAPRLPDDASLPRAQRETRSPLVLKEGEKERLERMVFAAGGVPAKWAEWQVRRAAALLYLAVTPALTKQQAAGLCHCSITLLNTLIRQYEADGLERVLSRQRGKWGKR
jgi:transposase